MRPSGRAVPGFNCSYQVKQEGTLGLHSSSSAVSVLCRDMEPLPAFFLVALPAVLDWPRGHHVASPPAESPPWLPPTGPLMGSAQVCPRGRELSTKPQLCAEALLPHRGQHRRVLLAVLERPLALDPFEQGVGSGEPPGSEQSCVGYGYAEATGRQVSPEVCRALSLTHATVSVTCRRDGCGGTVDGGRALG